MLKSFFAFLLCLNFPLIAQGTNENLTTPELLETLHGNTPTNCAGQIFSNALYEHANEVSDSDDEQQVRFWAKQTMESPDVLTKLLECDEIKHTADDTTIIFTPIIYEFPGKTRTITINYSTQPKVLKQKLILASKPSLPNGDANPKLMDPNDTAKYLNTEPAWYAIMVVQHDSLSQFVGPGKNNTLSVKYINDNIDSIYPHGYYCTSKSAIANDNDTINKVVHEVVDLEKDTNDYYVAGDVNLEWVMYAEIAAEVILTAATAGAGEGIMAGLKGVRATKNAKNLSKTVKNLSKMDDVKNYLENARKIKQRTDNIADIEQNLKNAKNYEKALKNAEKGGKNAAKYQKEADEILEAAKKIDKNMTPEKLKNADQLADEYKNTTKKLQDEIKKLEKTAKQMEKDSKNVKQYKESAETFSDLMKYRRELRAFRRPQTGNVITRNLKKIGTYGKSLKAANNGAKLMTKAGKLGRAGMSSTSAKIGDWLMDATLKHGSRLGRFTRDVGLIYGAIVFLGDMYDRTSSTSKEFSNGIEFKPLCLLSADDLEGYDNVVNYGMWIMFEGNSTDPADDDAAYLQAMDFAAKFYYQLDEYQDEHGANCNVDIYVVRPIIRLDETNMDEPKGELFYLFMNEIPWSTAEQFGEQIPNVADWERNQSELELSDPNGKYKHHEQNNEIANEITAAELTEE